MILDVDGKALLAGVKARPAGDGPAQQHPVQLEPEVTRSWTADLLAARIMRLHRLALMRARAEQRMRIIDETGAALPTTPGWPSLTDVDEYRRTIDF